MKRLLEIKFRFWDTFQKEMFTTSDMNSYEVWDTILDDRFKKQQYTGLKDKNDKEIFADDIIGIETHGVKRYQECVVCYDVFQAKFKSVPISAYLQNAGNGGWTGYELRWYCEVIGNIYQNPELLNR